MKLYKQKKAMETILCCSHSLYFAPQAATNRLCVVCWARSDVLLPAISFRATQGETRLQVFSVLIVSIINLTAKENPRQNAS